MRRHKQTPDGENQSFNESPFGIEATADASSLLPLAELLRDAVNRHLYPTDATDYVQSDLDEVFDAAFRDVAHDLLAPKLAALPPQEFVELYLRIKPDKTLDTELERLKAVRSQELSRRAQLSEIAYEAKISGQLQLKNLEAGNIITIGLFGSDKPQLAAKRYSENQDIKPLQRLLQVRLIEPHDGIVEIIHDTWIGAIWSASQRTEQIEPLSKGTLGTRPASNPNAAVKPVLSVHAPLVFVVENGITYTPPQIIGYIETFDQLLLLDGKP